MLLVFVKLWSRDIVFGSADADRGRLYTDLISSIEKVGFTEYL